MRRLVSTVHGVLTAATVTGALAVHGLGAWLTLALGHRPIGRMAVVPRLIEPSAWRYGGNVTDPSSDTKLAR